MALRIFPVNNMEVFQKYSELHAVSTRYELDLDKSLPEGSMEHNSVHIFHQKLNVYHPVNNSKYH
jgi:hypothetical protein